MTFDITANGNVIGIGSHSGVNLTGKDLTLTTVDNYTSGNSSGSVGMYGIVAGSSVISGEGGTADASRNGTFTTVSVGSAKITQTSVGGTKQPILNAGLRAIQGAYQDAGNGSSGKIVVNNDLDMSLSGRRMEGIYVSGAGTSSTGTEAVSQVILNGASTINLVNSGGTSADSSAIKVGKSRAVGTGKGLLVSNGALTINMDASVVGTQPYHGAAIKMAVSGSQLLADSATSSNNINASKTALAIGIDDWNSSTDSTGISASFGAATVRTKSTTAPLLLVDSGQQNVQLLFDRGSDLLAASDGYLIDVIKYRTSTASSSVQLTLDNASKMQGLTNKTYASSTVNVGMSNGSVWNMAVKTTSPWTSTLDALSMTTGSILNAFNQWDAGHTSATQFVMVGQVSSNASTINLQDETPTADDHLKIDGPYTSTNGVLAIDTCLGTDTAPSDILTVTGAVTGATTINIKPVAGSSCQGAQTTGNGILVAETGSSGSDAFALNGGSITQGLYVYKLVQVGTSWYLQSAPATGTLTVAKVVTPAAGAPAFSGTIPYTLTCTTPSHSETGSISVTNNQGVVDHTLPAGSQCSVAEGALPAAPAGYYWGVPSYVQPTEPLPVGGAQTATITNALVPVPSVSVACNPATLFDRADQMSTCTVTLSEPAPAGGLPITLTPPASSDRYTTTCASSLTVEAGATTATCTITAIANTKAGDGDVVATLALVAGNAYALGAPASASVTVRDDDLAVAPTPVPTLSQWALMLLGLGMMGGAWRQRRR